MTILDHDGTQFALNVDYSCRGVNLVLNSHIKACYISCIFPPSLWHFILICQPVWLLFSFHSHSLCVCKQRYQIEAKFSARFLSASCICIFAVSIPPVCQLFSATIFLIAKRFKLKSCSCFCAVPPCLFFPLTFYPSRKKIYKDPGVASFPLMPCDSCQMTVIMG